MNASSASESALTPAQAVEYLRERHNLEYSEEHLQRLARAAEAPSHKVGRFRMYRPSLLDAWALGEWPEKPDHAASVAALHALAASIEPPAAGGGEG